MVRVTTALFIALAVLGSGAQRLAPDVIPTADGPLAIQPIAHASVAITFGRDVILVDPARFGPGLPPSPRPSDDEFARAKEALRAGLPPDDPAVLVTAFALRPGQMDRFSGLPPATVVLITHDDTDHLDPRVLEALVTPGTRLIVPPRAQSRLLDVRGAEVIANGERLTAGRVTVEAVPMYNTRPDPTFGVTLHERGRGNGYVVTVAKTRLYIAGDTGCTAEMKALQKIDVAFLPMNIPYTMSPAEAAECARAFRPRIVYPYHYFESDLRVFETALSNTGIEVRLRDWYLGR